MLPAGSSSAGGGGLLGALQGFIQGANTGLTSLAGVAAGTLPISRGSSIVCRGCRLPIGLGRFVTALGGHYHVACFRCVCRPGAAAEAASSRAQGARRMRVSSRRHAACMHPLAPIPLAPASHAPPPNVKEHLHSPAAPPSCCPASPRCRCAGCHQPIDAASFSVGEAGEPYHHACHKQLFHPVCG